MLRIPPAPNKADIDDFVWYSWFNDLSKQLSSNSLVLQRKATDPTTSDIPMDGIGLWKNTTNGQIALWVNDGGTMTRIFSFALAS